MGLFEWRRNNMGDQYSDRLDILISKADKITDFRDEQRRLTTSVARIEEIIKGIHERLNKLPCDERAKTINNNSLKIAQSETKVEKAKWVLLLAVFSMLTSLGSLGSIIISYATSK